MIVKDQREALCVACEMERRAIGIYQRALTLTDKPEVRAGIQEILKDEREHLRRFSQVREQYCGITDAEERLLIAAMGAEALFPGGVMEMRRANSLDSLKNLYTFARDGFAPFREEYKAACVNLGRRVTFDLPDGGQGAGEAVDVDEEGRLVVRTDSGEVHVFTGEVSVHGIYGAV